MTRIHRPSGQQEAPDAISFRAVTFDEVVAQSPESSAHSGSRSSPEPRAPEGVGIASRYRISLVPLILLVSVLGCEKLPWPPKSASGQSATASSSAPSAPASTAPAKVSVPPSEVLATVNGVSISKADMELRITELKSLVASLNKEWKPLTHDQMENLVEELISNELMSQDALQRGLDRQTETQQRWEFLHRGFFMQEWLRWNQQRLDVSATDVQDYYEKWKLGFRVPERRKLRELVVAAEDQVKQALSQLLAGSVEFQTLAQQISVGPTAAKGGQLDGWIVRASEKTSLYGSDAEATAAGVISLDPVLEAAVFAIDRPGGFSNYVKGADNRFHLFQLVEREAERQRPLTEVYEQVKSYKVREKLQQAVADLEKHAKVERFPEHWDAVTQ